MYVRLILNVGLTTSKNVGTTRSLCEEHPPLLYQFNLVPRNSSLGTRLQTMEIKGTRRTKKFLVRRTQDSSPVDTTPEEFQKESSFFRLGLPSTLPVTKMKLFENALQTGGIWKRRLCAYFGVDRKHFECGAVRKRRHHDNHVISDRVFPRHKSKVTGDCCAFRFPRRSAWTENIWYVFLFQISPA